MDQKGKDLLNLMFRAGEQVCVSPNQFGFHSVSLENAIADRVKLVSTRHRDEGIPLEQSVETYPGTSLQLVALNPIRGWRNDASCTAFRNFMVECDDGALSEQLAYLKGSGIPYSAIVFSGSKSLHMLVSLENDLTDEKTWRHVAEWILNVMDKADPNTKNPSRSIRVPNAIRDGRKQSLVDMGQRVPNEALHTWLKRYPQCEPKIVTPRPRGEFKGLPNMKPWMVKALNEGLDPDKGRNKQWFSIAVECFLGGASLDDVIDTLEEFFTEDRDFKRKEWLTSIKSAEKYVLEKK